MAQTFNERFEGGTNGTTISTSNSAYTGGVGLTNTTAVFDNSTTAAGALCAKIVQTSTFGTAALKTASFTATSTMYHRMCINVPALPSGGNIYFSVADSSGTARARLALDPSGHIILQNGTTTIATSTTTLSTATWYRLELDLVGTAASCRIFTSPSATSATETISGTVSGSTFTQWWDGIIGSANTTVATFRIDEVINDSSATPGPVIQAATATASLTLTATGTFTPSFTATASLTLTASGTASSSTPVGDSMMGPGSTAGQAAADALQDVAQTELGPIFVNGAGQIVFTPRHARYNPNPLWTFGEQELPYSNLVFDYDTTHLANQVTVSRPGGTTDTVNDAASQKSYFVHNVAYTLQLAADKSCLDAANYLLSRYKQPSLRVSQMVLKPIANAALWPSVLGMEFGTCVAVNRRPPTTNIISQTTFVDHLEHVIDFTGGGTWTTTVVCTPADVTTYLVWDGAGVYGQWDNACWAY